MRSIEIVQRWNSFGPQTCGSCKIDLNTKPLVVFRMRKRNSDYQLVLSGMLGRRSKEVKAANRISQMRLLAVLQP